MEGPRHEPGQDQRPDALVGLDPPQAVTGLVDPDNPVLDTSDEVRDALAAQWTGLSDDQRAAFVELHGNRLRALKDQGLGPTPVLPETWKSR